MLESGRVLNVLDTVHYCYVINLTSSEWGNTLIFSQQTKGSFLRQDSVMNSEEGSGDCITKLL